MENLSFKKIVGLYGVSGVGKSRLLREIAIERPEWTVYEGSDVLGNTMKDEGGLTRFKELPRSEKDKVRTNAIKEIQKSSLGLSVVTGHFSFPVNSGEASFVFDPVFTPADSDVYRLIIYLDHLSASVIKDQRDRDPLRPDRPDMSESHIAEWVKYEMEHLRRQCAEHEPPIHFLATSTLGGGADAVLRSIENWLRPSVAELEALSAKALHRAIEALPSAEVYLLVDGDRTLCREDTAHRFFHANTVGENAITFDMLETIFKRSPTYTFEAFLQASLLYSKIPDSDYRTSALLAGQAVEIYPQWIRFFQSLPKTAHAVVVTSGLAEVWHAALDKNNLLVKNDGTPLVSLIAGNRIGHHNYIVDPAAKGMIVQQLRERRNGAMVIAFGDSMVDVQMLTDADRSYVVIDSKHNRSLKPFIASKVGTPEGSTVYQLDLAEKGLHAG